jgi:tripartite-type tricarboxylate transporter receptor subunit TctC
MRSLKKLTLVASLAALSLLMTTSAAWAQAYPSKPVRVVVPFPAGGIVDILTRAVTEKIASNWGNPIFVEAKPGAGALVGTEAVANAPADGYTFLVASITGAVGPIINPQFKYDLRKDFTAVGLFATAPNIIVVPPLLPVANMTEFTELARKSPGKLNYAHSGAGSTNHLPVEFLKMSRKLYIVPIAYRGQPQAITDVLSGQIQLFAGAPALLVPHVKAGKLKAIAVTSAKRLEDTPNVQTLAEGGFGDVQGGSGWFGIVAPVGTPPAVVQRFNEEINKALKAPEVVERLRKAYAFAEGGTPEEFTKFLNDEGSRWTRLVKEAGIKAE